MLERLLGKISRSAQDFSRHKSDFDGAVREPIWQAGTWPENGGRIYAVGDIHGRDDLLAALHAAIQSDAEAHPGRDRLVIYLGDLIDRGPASKSVIDRLLDIPIPGFSRIALMGNHEECLLSFLDDIAVGPSWFAFGGIATVESYGVAPPASMAGAELARVQKQLRSRMPERHLRFLRNLPLSHVEGNYFFVHAGIRPGVPLTAQTSDDLLWIRNEFLFSEADFGKTIVHGHTVVAEPDRRPNRIGIDTGAFRTGTLTCLVLSKRESYFLQTRK